MSSCGTSAGRHHGDRSADRDAFVYVDDESPDHTGPRRLQLAGDLVGVDLTHRGALREFVAHRDQPFGDLARLHGQAPLGHRDPLNSIVCH